MTPGQAQACRATASTTTALALSLLLPLGALRGCSSFLLPAPFVGRSPPSCKTWASSPSTADTPDAKESVPTHPGDEEAEDDQTRSPAGLTLEGVYRRLKLDTPDLDDGTVGLESKDTDYGIEIVKVKVHRRPSLGLQLEEVARGGDGRGLVLVAGIKPWGNAEATGKIFPGDTLCWVGVEPDRMTRVEAFDWDQTVSALGEYTGDSDLTLVIKRLVKRETIKVMFEMPDGSRDYDIKTGSNLRGEMIRLDVPVYDPKTLRYDQPYVTGNCGGEGICGTCFVKIKEGEELVSPPDEEEQLLLAKGNLPKDWRLSCKTIIGRENTPGTVRVKAVPQTQWREERRGRQ